VTREAYSREVISFGFWFGDDTFPEPAFFSYTAPEPVGLAREPLQPKSAEWTERDDGHLAVLRYDHARAQADPRAAVLAFYESAYQAGARHAGWDIDRLACPGGITDPPDLDLTGTIPTRGRSRCARCWCTWWRSTPGTTATPTCCASGSTGGWASSRQARVQSRRAPPELGGRSDIWRRASSPRPSVRGSLVDGCQRFPGRTRPVS
jgi:hypothetical protein